MEKPVQVVDLTSPRKQTRTSRIYVNLYATEQPGLHNSKASAERGAAFRSDNLCHPEHIAVPIDIIYEV